MGVIQSGRVSYLNLRIPVIMATPTAILPKPVHNGSQGNL